MLSALKGRLKVRLQNFVRRRLGIEVHRVARRSDGIEDELEWKWDRQSPPPRECELAICAVFKNEAPYLAEWLEFHILLGAEKFFLYDNNSDDDFLRVLSPYIQSGHVVLNNWPPPPPCQVQAYHRCLENYGYYARWIAFLDIDEFLFPVADRPLLEVLRKYEEFPGLAVHWVMFTTSGHLLKPDGLMTEHYTDCQSEGNKHVKILVDPRRTECINGPHSAVFCDGATAVTEKRRPLTQAFAFPPSVEVLRVNHYWTKSVEEFLAKAEKGNADKTARRATDLIMAERTYHTGQDHTIQRYVPELKARLKARFPVPSPPPFSPPNAPPKES